MSKWEILYVKLDAFWDKIPAPIKVPMYQLLSAGFLLLIDKFLLGKSITQDMWTAIWSAFLANEALVIQEWVRKNLGNIDELKAEYNKKSMDR
jgi:hypothetical protein